MEEKTKTMTMTMKISQEFRDQIAEAAEAEHMTTTQWVSMLIREKLNKSTSVDDNDVDSKLEVLNTKADTIINLISKL